MNEISVIRKAYMKVTNTKHFTAYKYYCEIINNQVEQLKNEILCLWFRESLIYVNNCPTRCNTNQSVIILHVHSTCFGCQPHPSSGIHKTVTTASGTVQLPPSNVAKLAWPRLLTALILRFLVFWIKEKSSQGRL